MTSMVAGTSRPARDGLPGSHDIVAEALARRFGDLWAVQDLSFVARSQEIFGLVGPMGSGKTTSLRMLTTLLAPSRGSASVLGCDLRRDAARVRAQIGVMLQEPTLDLEATVAENLAFYLSMRGVRDPVERIAEAVGQLGLEAVKDRRVGELSWGTKRCVELARACSGHPRALLLDEPTQALDASARARVLSVLDAFRSRPGHVVLVSTHDPPMIAACDRVHTLPGGPPADA